MTLNTDFDSFFGMSMDNAAVEAFDILGVEIYDDLHRKGPQLMILNNYLIVASLWRSFTRKLVDKNQILTSDLRNQGGNSI